MNDDLCDRRGLRGTRVVVDQDQIRDLLVLHERRGVALVARADGDQIRAEGLDLVVARTELRSVLAAVDAAEVAQEHDDDGLLGPEVTELVLRAGRVGQLEGIEGGEVHRGQPMTVWSSEIQSWQRGRSRKVRSSSSSAAEPLTPPGVEAAATSASSLSNQRIAMPS